MYHFIIIILIIIVIITRLIIQITYVSVTLLCFLVSSSFFQFQLPPSPELNKYLSSLSFLSGMQFLRQPQDVTWSSLLGPFTIPKLELCLLRTPQSTIVLDVLAPIFVILSHFNQEYKPLKTGMVCTVRSALKRLRQKGVSVKSIYKAPTVLSPLSIPIYKDRSICTDLQTLIYNQYPYYISFVLSILQHIMYVIYNYIVQIYIWI